MSKPNLHEGKLPGMWAFFFATASWTAWCIYGEYYIAAAITTRREEAMLSGMYFGEEFILPDLLKNAIRYALGRKQAQPITFYYYGIPDDEMRERFGIEGSADVGS